MRHLTLGAVIGMVATWCCIVLSNAGTVQVEDAQEDEDVAWGDDVFPAKMRQLRERFWELERRKQDLLQNGRTG